VDLPIEIVVVGYHEGDVYDIIIQNLTASKQIPYRTIEWAGTENYMEGYQGDILIVPSKATEFNSYKSNIKALEAAALNIPIVVSKAEPYLSLQVNYFSGDNEFVSEITRLVQSEEYRKHSAKKNRDFCLENYSLDKWSKQRLNIYQKILDDSRQ